MVLYFTQSRGNSTGLRVEEALGELFLGVPYDPNQAAPPFEDYLGYYWEGEDDELYRAIVRDGEDLALEIVGRAVVPLTYAGEDRWKLRPNPSKVLAFERSPAGEVTGYRVGDHREYRFQPSPELPDAGELATRVAETHRMDLLESLGPIRMQGRLTVERLGITGESTAWLAWPDRWRVDESAGGESGSVAFDGERIRYAAGGQPAVTLEGQAAELLRLGHPFARFGDWRLWHPRLQVIQRIEGGGRAMFLVRAGDTSAPAQTLFVDAETGRVLRVSGMTHVEPLGRIGMRATFDDFRDVSGMLLPFQSEVVLMNPMLGPMAVMNTLSEVELGVELPEGTFELPE